MTAEDRQRALVEQSRALHRFYCMNDQEPTVTLFEEDYNWLLKRGAIQDTATGLMLDSNIPVRRGYRKKKRPTKRPKESML